MVVPLVRVRRCFHHTTNFGRKHALGSRTRFCREGLGWIRYARTTLEAKWAAFFHHLRWDHVYNPFADGTVSFVIHGGGEPFFVLVTDAVTEADYLDRGLDNDSGRDVVVVGVSPLPTLLDGGDAVGLLCREGDLGCAVVRWWSDGTLWFRVADDDRVFRRHGDVRAAWAKATNDIQAVA
jgi:hypothetical protein